jgi:hypothetical protein
LWSQRLSFSRLCLLSKTSSIRRIRISSQIWEIRKTQKVILDIQGGDE